MSELISSPTPESLTTRFEATGFTPNDELDLHTSTLGTRAAGLARADIVTATRAPEHLETLSHKEIAKVGLRLAGLRQAKINDMTLSQDDYELVA